MFDQVGNFFGGVKNFFVDAYNSVKNGVVAVYDKVTGVGSNVIGTVYADLKNGITGTGNILNNVVDTGKSTVHEIIDGTKSVIQHGQDTIGGIGQSFALPVTIVAGIVGMYYLTKKS